MPLAETPAAPVSIADEEHAENISYLETLAEHTFGLWDEVWVGFSWPSYYINHTRRVRNLCLQMAQPEGGDPKLLEYAAVLHDITKRYDGEIIRDARGNRAVGPGGLWQNQPLPPPPGSMSMVTEIYDRESLTGSLHSESGAVVADHLLQILGMDDATRESASQVIRDHVRLRDENGAIAPPELLESRILYDADTLDANLGLVAFYRNIQIHTHKLIRECGHATLKKYVGFIPRWLQMKQPFVDMMTTDRGRRLAHRRQGRVEAAYRDLMNEIGDVKRFRDEGLMGVIEFFMGRNESPDLVRDLQDLRDTWLPNGPKQPYVHSFFQDLEDEIAGKK